MNPGLSGVIERGLHFIRSQQRTDGEIASIADHPPARRDLPGPVYVRSPFLSAFVVESLRTLDAPSAQPIIDRIRRFLRAEEEADGRWRFLGRGASIDPDADCTACAAAALGPEAAAARYQTALTRFEDPCGLYSSYVNAEGLRYSWILDGGKVVLGFDRVVNANVARYLGIIGQPCERVWSFLDKELSAGPLEEGSPDYPNPMCFLFMVARAARSSSRLLSPAATARLRRELEATLATIDAGRQPLTVAMALAAARAARLRLSTSKAALATLSAAQAPDGGWPEEALFVGGFRARSLTTAMALECLAHAP